MQRGGRLGHQTPSRAVSQGQDSCPDTSTQLQKLENEAVLHGGRSAGPQGRIDPVTYSNPSPRAVEGTGEVPLQGSPSVHAVRVQGQQLQVVAPELISVADYLAHSAATRSVGASQRQLLSPARSSLDERREPGQLNERPAGNAYSLAFPGAAGYYSPSGSSVIESIVSQPLSSPSQQPVRAVHHLAQGLSSRIFPDGSIPKAHADKQGQRSPHNPFGGLSSGGPSSVQGASTTTPSLPFSPSRTNPLQSSPVKPIKSIMSVATNQPPTEVVELRRKTLEEKRKTLKDVQNSYVDKLTELFFLQQSHNMMDYVIWKKKQPDLQLASYLKSRQLEERIQDQISEVKVSTSSSSNASLSTPATISAQLPQDAAAQLKKRLDGEDSSRKGQPGSGGSSIVSASEARKRSSSQAGLDEAGEERSVKLSIGGSEVLTKSETSSTAPSRTLPSITVIPATPTIGIKSGGEEAPLVTKVAVDASDVKGSIGLASPLQRNISGISGPSALGQLSSINKSLIRSPLPPGLSRDRQGTRQGALSAVYDYTIGSQEMIVERAKQEAQVMQRIAELRRDGLWSAKRLPRVQEPPRHKAHWDYLLEEMQWLAADFAQERRWKKNAARKLARAVAKHHQDQEAREMKAGKEEVQKLKRIAGNIAKEIKAFWANIEKVVQYKQQSRLDERRKKALDLQLDFIVGQTEKYSSWLTEGLNTSTAASSAQASSVSSPRSDRMVDDIEFEPQGDDSDDEETIDVEEKQAAKAGEVAGGVSEIELLQRESELPIEELLSSLQAAQKKEEEEKKSSGGKAEEGTSKKREEDQPDAASLVEVTAPDSKISESKDDKDFELSADEEEIIDDDENTLDEQEETEGAVDHKAELDDLAADGEIPMEELMKRYQGAYAEDFDFSDADEDESEEDDDEEEDSSQDSSSEEEELEETEEEEEEDDQDKDELKDVGMEYLINPEKENEDLPEKAAQGTSEEAGANMEITDIAAAAQSLQPTGYTLSDTQVKTKVPFLLRHELREYQHIGLDWLVTMLEKKLNGILADEMGLGKTIQTIALLAHLACDEGCWGPHLIVVPTSVMLNWEMELKKWCPAFKILTYYGSQKERKLKRTGWTKSNAFHVCITSYKLVIQDHQSFRRKKWKYLILDEAQNIKNFKSQRWQTLLNFSSQRRLLLTGTPLQNNLMELWSLMHFLMPHVFQSHREFKEWFSNPLGGMIEGTQEYNEGIIRRLHKVLRPFLLRRLKSQVEKQLPQKYEHVIRCRLSKRQRFLYDDFMAQRKTKETLSTGHFMSVINVLMQLRKVCNHPDLFEERAIVSPFIMVGLLYYTASLVHRVMEYNPLQQVSLRALNLCIADLEISLPAYAAHRTCQLQTPRKLIEEIDSAPAPPSRPPRVKVKPGKLYPSPMALQAQKEARPSPSLVNRPSDRASPSALHIHGRGSPSMVRVASPNIKGTPGPPGLTQVLVRSASGVSLQPRASTPPQGTAVGTSQILQAQGRPGTPPVTLTAISNPRSPGTLTLVSQNPQPVPSGTPLQQLPGYTGTVSGSVGSQLGQRRVLLQQQQVSGVGTNGRAQLITTQPITVQLQSGSSTSTQQTGQRLLAGQIRQLPQGGIVQIIQTSGGQQIIRPAVHLTTQANLVNAQRTANSTTQVVQRSGTPQMVLSHTAAQLQAAQQLHQSIQRQLTAQGVSPSQAQAVASQLSKVTAAQSPLQLQQRQIVLQQQQQPQQVVINAKGASVHTTPATQTITCATTSSRPSSPSVTIVQAARTVNASSPTLGTIKTSSPSTKTVVAVSLASDRTTNAASPTPSPKVVRAQSPSVKTSIATVSPKEPTSLSVSSLSPLSDSVPFSPLTPLKTPVIRLKPIKLQPSEVSTVKEESRESKELKEAAEKFKKAEKKRKSSPLYLESLDKARADDRKACLSRIATFNQQRCSAKPVYGQDLFTAVSLYHTSKPAGKRRPFSNGVGNVHCYHALIGDALRRVEVAYKKTRNLRSILHTPEDYLEELQQINKRYTFVVPVVTAPLITMHTSHTPPSVLNSERTLMNTLSSELKPKSWCLHPIENLMRLDMPELRLIQYDCGKLQTMDGLLRKLKTEGSRVLIFTQMTKMLDILERFLNFHGHIYLRLDGTTKVEQRQIMMERFNKDPRIFCFILSTRSGGMGVNLTGANAVIFYDSDWNPTMDAQAQDRCHRIGQTRDVHIYRLISEMSIEENILKKSNQKRLLIDVSIEGGNFTTAFFKKHTIKDIFDVSKSAGILEDLMEVDKTAEPNEPEQPKEPKDTDLDAKADKPLSQTDLEKALARAEDDTDVKAASRAHAEQDAELAEFDEDIPYEGEEGKGNDESSKLEKELTQLDNQLTPIERYAVVYLEETLEPITAEQLKEAEEQVEAAKREWELGRLQGLKEQEEREAELEEDDVLYTYSREDSENQVYISQKEEIMPIWAPPTPPQDDNDVYIDHVMCLGYEPSIMTESQLPSVFHKKETKKIKVEQGAVVPARKIKSHGHHHHHHHHQKSETVQQTPMLPAPPQSLFNRPSAALIRMRREAKQQKMRALAGKPVVKPMPVVHRPATIETTSLDKLEWLINEDWALLQAVQTLLELPLTLQPLVPGHIINWDLVSDIVNACSRTFRSPKQCCNRYESVIIPREEGKILYDTNPKKQKKSKGIYRVSTKNNRPMKSSQLHAQDGNSSHTMLYSSKFDGIKMAINKRQPFLKQVLNNPLLKNPKHSAILAESGINYDKPMVPSEVALKRAERIAREKKLAALQAQQKLAREKKLQQEQQQQQRLLAATKQQQAQQQGTATQVTAQPVGTAAGATVLQSGTISRTALGTTVTQPIRVSGTLAAQVVRSQGIRTSVPQLTLPNVTSQVRTLGTSSPQIVVSSVSSIVTTGQQTRVTPTVSLQGGTQLSMKNLGQFSQLALMKIKQQQLQQLQAQVQQAQSGGSGQATSGTITQTTQQQAATNQLKAELRKLQQAQAQAQAVQAQAQAQAQATSGQLTTIQKATGITTQAITGVTHVQLTQAQRQQLAQRKGPTLNTSQAEIAALLKHHQAQQLQAQKIKGISTIPVTSVTQLKGITVSGVTVTGVTTLGQAGAKGQVVSVAGGMKALAIPTAGGSGTTTTQLSKVNLQQILQMKQQKLILAQVQGQPQVVTSGQQVRVSSGLATVQRGGTQTAQQTLVQQVASLQQVGTIGGQQVRVQQVTAPRGQQQTGTVQVQRIPTSQLQGQPMPTVRQQLQQQVKRVPQTLSIQQQGKPVTIIPPGRQVPQTLSIQQQGKPVTIIPPGAVISSAGKVTVTQASLTQAQKQPQQLVTQLVTSVVTPRTQVQQQSTPNRTPQLARLVQAQQLAQAQAQAKAQAQAQAQAQAAQAQSQSSPAHTVVSQTVVVQEESSSAGQNKGAAQQTTPATQQVRVVTTPATTTTPVSISIAQPMSKPSPQQQQQQQQRQQQQQTPATTTLQAQPQQQQQQQQQASEDPQTPQSRVEVLQQGAASSASRQSPYAMRLRKPSQSSKD